MITITEHDRNEFTRMSKCGYVNNRDDVGARMQVAAETNVMQDREYYSLKSEYRNWLVFNQYRPTSMNPVMWLYIGHPSYSTMEGD